VQDVTNEECYVQFIRDIWL